MRPKRLGFLAVAMSNEIGGAEWIKSVGPSLTLGLGHMWKLESDWGVFGAYH